MSIELKQAAQQVLDAFDDFGAADDFATMFALTQKMNALHTAIQQSKSKHRHWSEALADDLAESGDIQTDTHPAIQQAEAQQPATGEPVQADSSGHLRVIASLGAALRRLSFAAQTTGGTDGPDAELQSAIGQAEQALSLGGIGQAMFATTEPVFTSRFGRVVLSGPREDVEFAVRHLPDVDDKTTTPQPSQAAQAESEPVGARKALERIASWSEHPAMLGVDYGSNVVRDYYRKIARDALTHHAPGVPDDSKRLDYLQDRGATIDLIPGVAGFYPMRFRVGGLHSSANIDVRAAIDAAMLVAKEEPNV